MFTPRYFAPDKQIRYNKNNMRMLTNDYQDCELLNLATNKNGHGPYVIRQDGVPPGSSSSQEDRFLLRKDGTWVLDVTAFTLAEKEQEQFVFQNAAELYATVQETWREPRSGGQIASGKKSRGT